ncbi:ABC transporter ATP-binding protein [Butyrivibrio sp. MC2021]|uniref:ABC transporter ATP-binding protein n=1 Tax=Butyrivibrio sp. MC2021 TaxID=1408306 RepID=UPI00047B0DCC|nr:ABC transporter ATP-binding protein [Butyrivibrio sp. MC2021]
MVKVDNLVKNYGDFKLDVSLEIPDGTVTGIVGKNGAGKSTTIKSILGLVKPDGGHVSINGKEASKLSGKDKEEIGVALSDSGFSTFLSVKDIIAIFKKMYPSFNEELFRKNCSSQKLSLDKPIKEFSTGMRAKLRVLVAMSHNAQLLIMDEPTAGLDVEARNDILDLLRNYLLEDEKRSILITSHISSDLEGLCDDIYLIHDGKIVLHEDTDAILSNYGVLKVDEAAYEKLDKSYILSTKKDHFGYTCFTNEKQFYVENNPDIVIENSDIDNLILMMTGGN